MMFTVPMHLQASSVPFHVAQTGAEPMLNKVHRANCKVFPVWVAWGEPGGSFYTAKSVKFCLN